ncbi:RING-H2 finger protein ATL39-like [Solanum verrucosum]|uniref:RING-H2 finger protein ATL39-like n=1 Tax=Solanum verrucosum TaxID=315347 RepID=UPI0020D19073|nr:RING-H2 finger protein ATL39-like [Solanum verrucosum]
MESAFLFGFFVKRVIGMAWASTLNNWVCLVLILPWHIEAEIRQTRYWSEPVKTPPALYYFYAFLAIFIVFICFFIRYCRRCCREANDDAPPQASEAQQAPPPVEPHHEPSVIVDTFLLIPLWDERCGDFDTCAICTAELDEVRLLRVLPCGHIYHHDCILDWMLTGALQCPYCRYDIVL